MGQIQSFQIFQTLQIHGKVFEIIGKGGLILE